MIDPTHTTTLRKAYTAEYDQRWKQVRKQAKEVIVDGRLAGFTPEQQGNYYGRWLASFVGATVGGAWQNMHLRGAYMRGIANAHQDLRLAGRRVSEGDVLHQFSHLASLGMIYGWAEADLKRIQSVLAPDAAGKVALGLATGMSAEKIAELVDGRIRSVGSSRTRMLVNTLVVGAVAEAMLNRLTDFGIRTVSAQVEYQFTTAGDDRVCATCQALATADNGLGPGVYSIQQARGVIPVHGRCRCTWRLRR